MQVCPGEFVMGLDHSKYSAPAHRVRISKPFYLGKYEVTQAQWQQVMRAKPWGLRRDVKEHPRQPASCVSWRDCRRFMVRLDNLVGSKAFRLPTEAEWEYACRAGSAAIYHFGDNHGTLETYDWYSENSDGSAHSVGAKRPNAWGVYDLHGNLREWCRDWFAGYTAGAQTDPCGPSKGRSRTIRGGSYQAGGVSSAGRGSRRPGGRYSYLGLRLALRTEPSPLPPIAPQDAMKPFDELMTEFMSTHEVPGAALAVTKDGRLVYARGFGFADREQTRPVQPDSLFRIASISKPITATAVMLLAERGRLMLDAKVFGLLDYTPHLKAGAKADPRLKDITVRHLLLHQGGWDRGKTFSVMGISGTARIARALGVPMPPAHADVIRYMMGQPLQFAPGTESKYSNFGYILLGRVIEKVTGQTYEEYVKQHVLAPLGIKTMQIGRTAQEDLVPNEVHYGRERKITARFGPHKGKPVVVPYARCIPIMDANGGWIASAVDLMRFAVAFDTPADCPILSQESIKKMFARPDDVNGFDADGNPRPSYYAYGWAVKPNGLGQLTTSHGGGMEGTSTSLVRRHDGVNWAILFNCYGSPHSRGSLAGQIGESLHFAADAVKDWPEGDLFAQFR